MAEKMSEVYNAYDMHISQVMRGRGAWILKTDKGIYQLKSLDVNPSRLSAEYQFKEGLENQGFQSIDSCVKNEDEELYTCDRYGNPYVLRRFFLGRECNPVDMDDVVKGVKNLANFHKVGRSVFEDTDGDVHIRVTGDYRKRNQCIKRVRNYITKQRSKREFEEKFLKSYDYFSQQGLKCQEEYEAMVDDSGKEQDAKEKNGFEHLGYCHGMYNHHSLVMTEDLGCPVGTISFDKFYLGNQMDDLYHYLRKTLEKNDYDFKVMSTIIDEYNKVNPICKEDLNYIYTCYCYPEKFYKLANQYINGTKNWLSPKLLEKLDKMIQDEGKKQQLLENMRKEYL